MPRRKGVRRLVEAEVEPSACCHLLTLVDHEPALLQAVLEEVRDMLALFRLMRASKWLHGLVQPQLHTLLPPLRYTAAEDLVECSWNHFWSGVWAKIYTLRPSGGGDPEPHDIEVQASLEPNLSNRKWKKRLERALAHGPCINSVFTHNGGDHSYMMPESTTALGSAIRNGHVPVVRFLLLHGADPNLFDGSGRRPLQLCLERLYHVSRSTPAEMMHLLLRAGADPTLKRAKVTEPTWVTVSSAQLTPLEELHKLVERETRYSRFEPDSERRIRLLQECVSVLEAPRPTHRMQPRVTSWQLPADGV